MGLQPARQLRPVVGGRRAVIGTVRVDLPAARRLLCWYGVFALLAPRLRAPTCPLRLLTGRRCPACGLTTAVSAALHGRIRHAATLHRLGPVTAAAVLVAAFATVGEAVRHVACPRSRRCRRGV